MNEVGFETERVPLPPSFYRRDTVLVAQELLNCLLICSTPEGSLVGRITETEAYTEEDPASHSFRGVRPRNRAMFEAGGRAYLYLCYGMYHCLNAVTMEAGKGCAVLLRAVEPLSGIPLMAQRRQIETATMPEPSSQEWVRYARKLCGGPGKLCQAYGLSLAQDNHDLTLGENLWIAPPDPKCTRLGRCVATPRIGISQGIERLWRFHLEDDPFLSRKSGR